MTAPVRLFTCERNGQPLGTSDGRRFGLQVRIGGVWAMAARYPMAERRDRALADRQVRDRVFYGSIGQPAPEIRAVDLVDAPGEGVENGWTWPLQEKARREARKAALAEMERTP